MFCDCCNKEISDNIVKCNHKVFCDKNCQYSYYNPTRNCKYCKKLFTYKKSENKVYCNLTCKKLGKRKSTFIAPKTICDWCGKNYKSHNKRFCSLQCKRDWYAQVWSQSPEWKEKSKLRAVSMLENNLINKVNTGIQIKINNFLDESKIIYITEKSFNYFSVDIYIPEFNLVIENMGSYWHCDHRKYPKIIYSQHVDRIKNDKIKHSCLVQKNINPLYLWEYEINTNMLLCEKLIIFYINNKGILKDYHSFNYHLEYDNLVLNDNLEIPYMDWNINILNKIIDIKIKEKRSMKQTEKWMSFKCDSCGKEKVILISHFKVGISHCCSRECSSHFLARRKAKP